MTYPLMLDLTGRRAVVVGGGRVAHRRAEALLAAGAQVHVIAPQVDPALAGLPVTVSGRRYRDGDLAGAWLVHAATDDPAVNAAVAADAERERIWCVRADDAARSRAWTPAVARHGDLTVAVTRAVTRAGRSGCAPRSRSPWPTGPCRPGRSAGRRRTAGDGSRWSAAAPATPGC